MESAKNEAVPAAISEQAQEAIRGMQLAREKVAKDYIAGIVGLMPFDLEAVAEDGELISVHGAFACPEHYDLKAQIAEISERLIHDGMVVRSLVGFTRHPWKDAYRALAVDTTLIIPISQVGGE